MLSDVILNVISTVGVRVVSVGGRKNSAQARGGRSRARMMSTSTSIPHRRATLGRGLFNRTLPFEAVGWIAAAVDFIIIMAVSILADVGYQWVFLNSGGSDERFVGVGLLIFANFSAIAAARGNYQQRNLLNSGRQVREVILAWALVALMLLGVAFSLKIAGTFSRVSTVTLLVLGCA